jgi:hypothetical protein
MGAAVFAHMCIIPVAQQHAFIRAGHARRREQGVVQRQDSTGIGGIRDAGVHAFTLAGTRTARRVNTSIC